MTAACTGGVKQKELYVGLPAWRRRSADCVGPFLVLVLVLALDSSSAQSGSRRNVLFSMWPQWEKDSGRQMSDSCSNIIQSERSVDGGA